MNDVSTTRRIDKTRSADGPLPRWPQHPPAPQVRDSGADVKAAADLAQRLLGGDRERLAHSSAVAARAEVLAVTVPPDQRAALLSAAWLHDIGYSLAIQQSGFHPVDGARHLQRLGWAKIICDLVGHHSGSRFVATVRKLEPDLTEFAFEEGELSDALTVADQTIGPGGQPMTINERLSDMLRRHGPDSPNALAHVNRERYLLGAAKRVAHRMEQQGQSPRHHRILLPH
jgi:hypothetical protein